MGATVVISGSGRGAGKTAVGCALIRALPEWTWTAVKITPDVHGDDGSRNTFPEGTAKSGLEGKEQFPRIFIETDRNSPKGTGRYLAAGARQAVLVTVDPEWDVRPFAELGAVIDGGSQFGNLLVESNRFSGKDAIYLAVIDRPEANWKHTFHICVDTADALVLTHSAMAGNLPERLRGKPLFSAREGDWAPAELVLWVRGQFRDRNGSGR